MTKTPQEQVSERLKEAMLLRKMRQTDLSSASGISKSLISSILKNEVPMTEKSLNLLAEALRISPQWIHSGIGDIPAEADQETALAKFVYRVLHQEQGTFKARLIDRLIELSDEDWATLERIFEAKEGD